MALFSDACAGLALTIGLCLAAPALSAPAPTAPAAAETAMPLGSPAFAPPGYIFFCQREPGACGADENEVLNRARLTLEQLATLTGAAPPGAPGPGAAEVAGPSPPDRPAPAAPPSMTPELWATLDRINDRVNRAIRPMTDTAIYGAADVWNTPLEHRMAVGDCEDFVLEKERALLAAGLPRRALNIAIVATPRGESHAVLLVATSSGEFVLDNLDRWVRPWRETRYIWRQRQLDGEAFKWMMVRRFAAAA